MRLELPRRVGDPSFCLLMHEMRCGTWAYLIFLSFGILLCFCIIDIFLVSLRWTVGVLQGKILVETLT